MRHGSDAQRQEFLPRILRGEMLFAIGYSEAGAGTDLAGAQDQGRARRRRLGDQRREDVDQPGRPRRLHLAGGAHGSRGEEAPRHLGLPGADLLAGLQDHAGSPRWAAIRTNATFYDDVRVPAANLIGGENNGWGLITGQLNHERVVADERRPGAPDPRRGAPLGAGDQAGRRPPRDRRALGAGELRARPRQARGAAADELEAGLGAPARPAPPGRCLGRQGLRQRVLRRGLPRPARDLRRAGPAAGATRPVRC